MFRSAEYTGTYFNTEGLPTTGLPEVVLCGRSNVGKSSFINSICNREKLAKTSSTPGKTRTINYYLIEKSFYFVDLPGFGYAKVSRSEQAKWADVIDKYFNFSKNIALSIHLIDAFVPDSNLDGDFHNFVTAKGFRDIKLLTKTDKLNQKEMSKNLKIFSENYPGYVRDESFFLYSIKNSKYQKTLVKFILNNL
ncbi:MAG: YihA family ribosome biogenesis GTP-binding protein [Ignavibacteriaceae bacterium]|nr:YihA family ribosome biogenesis GTP-binding protein [Ignavibacteriaceae bacterium]